MTTLIAPHELLHRPTKQESKHIVDLQDKIIDKLGLGDPYFARNGFVLYRGDCTRLMPCMGQRVDLTITSPPYNIGKEYETDLTVEEYVDWCGKWMRQIYRISKSCASFWLNIGHMRVPNIGRCVPIPYLIWKKNPFYLVQEVVWTYGAGVQTKTRLSPRNEKLLFCVKNKDDYVFNLDSIRDRNVKYPNQKKNGKLRCNPLGKNPSDVWDVPKVTSGRSSKERTAHPAQYPLALILRLVLASSNKYDLVFDPFAGSCTTGIAAVGSNRLFVGIERSTEYCKLSVQRFRAFERART